LSGVPFGLPDSVEALDLDDDAKDPAIDFQEIERRRQSAKRMDVYTGELINKNDNS
jgi:hypothetical protein